MLWTVHLYQPSILQTHRRELAAPDAAAVDAQ